MEFGIDKCAMLVAKRGLVQRTEWIKLPDEQTIKGLNQGDTYKYQGILQADKVKYAEMKDKVKTEYSVSFSFSFIIFKFTKYNL